MITIVDTARCFAIGAHEAVQHVRKYTGEPYITHLEEVATLVKDATGDLVLEAASWLHDVVEDTPITHDHILRLFGTEISTYVWYLTNVEDPTRNRAARMEENVRRLSQAPYSVQTIKCVDLISNTSSIVERDPKFAPTYLAEKKALLAVMTNCHPDLYRRACEICN